MASSYSTDLKLELMVTGENAGTWGDITNTNLNILQQAIAGYQAVSIAGGAQTTALVMSNAALSNARNAVIELTGTITGNQIVTIPDGIEKTYIIYNNTIGAFTVQFKTVTGTGPTFGTTDKSTKVLYSNGTNVIDTLIDTTNGVNTLTNKTLTSPIINTAPSPTFTTAATLNAQGELRLADSDSSNYVGFKSGATVTTNTIWTLPTADGTSNQALVTNGSGVLTFASAAGIVWQSVQTSGFTAVAGRAYPCNTTSAGFTVTLPSTPNAGEQIQLVDYAGTFDTNPLFIDPNGGKIEGGTSNLSLSGDREGIILTYIDSTQGWLATSGINEGTEAFAYTADFLVIAGGGGGGGGQDDSFGGGAGGAGGYRNSYSTESSGGGGISEQSLRFTRGTVYTITVGAGGAGTTNGKGVNGSDSSLSGNDITTITSTGGGGGAGNVASSANSGGSGGGSNQNSVGTNGSGTFNQGFNGGLGGPGSSSGGGGGGAGAVGVAAPTSSAAGAGGNGLASSITGSSVTRGGGGGGGAGASGTAANGGTGGGGNGANSSGTATAGTANTGGGGGAEGGGTAGTGNHGVGRAGGSGVVILRMPTGSYSGTTTGSPTVSTSGSDTILVYNASGTYTG